MIIIDRQNESTSDSAENRSRYIERNKRWFKNAIKDITIDDLKNGIKVATKGKGAPKELPLPVYTNTSGRREMIVIGLTEPKGYTFFSSENYMEAGGAGSEGTGGGGSEEFIMNSEDLQNLFFDNLELPNFVKEGKYIILDTKMKRVGIGKEGIQSKLSKRHTIKAAIQRVSAQKHELDTKIAALEEKVVLTEEEQKELTRLLYYKQLKLADSDLRFYLHRQVPFKSKYAVLYCVMDASGSITDWMRTLSKQYFYLLYLFLSKHYKNMDIRWITHATEAQFTDEDEFFEITSEGGTMISSALKLIQQDMKGIKDLANTNVYIAQTSDGDNWEEDNPKCIKLITDMLPNLQYYAYLNTWAGRVGTFQREPSYCKTMETLNKLDSKCQWSNVIEGEDVFKVLFRLFGKK